MAIFSTFLVFKMVSWRLFLLILLVIFIINGYGVSGDVGEAKCEELLDGQYQCGEPDIDPKTQSAKGCSKNHSVEVECTLLPGLECDNNGETVSTFMKRIPCRYTDGHDYKTALLLSIFLGMFGIDRFYLGYPAIGLLKFCTLGFFFLFQLIDIILIATQVVGPSDGSNYVIDYYGSRLIKVNYSNDTYLKPQ